MPKNTERVALATPVVCDTGFLVEFMENYVLEEEGIKLDGFVEVATTMAEYIVRYLSDTVEGVFIVLSKLITSWILLDVQVKDI